MDLMELLAYPYLWKPAKITAFLKATWNIIKDGGHPDFVKNLSDNSNQVLTSSTHSWVEVVGEEHWNILKCDGKGKVRQKINTAKSKCVVELVRLIRNKYEHCLEYEDGQKKVLNWFNLGELVDEKFVAYWIAKFPLLVTFLWINFYKFRNHSTLKDYYLLGYSSTNLWKPEKILKFVQQCWKILKNTRSRQFTNDLDMRSYRAFWFNEPVWVRVIGKKHWNILKCDASGILRHKLNGAQSKSIIDLLRLIWDKYEDCREYKPEDKLVLGWFDKRGDLDEGKFITYWINMFPSMLPFLWSSFDEFKYRSGLKEFYPGWKVESDFELTMNLNDYAEQLDKSLQAHLEEGELLMRFKYQNDELSKTAVEFRAINGLEKILDGHSAVSVHLNLEKGCLSATHYSKTNGLKNSLEYPGLSIAAKQLQLIFVDDILDDSVWNICKGVHNKSRIIIFGDGEKMSDVKIVEACKMKMVSGLNEITENPVCWKDLSRLKRKRLFKQSKVIIQGKVEKIKSIFRGYKTHDILDGLSGQFLNRLLKYQNVLLFGEYKPPEVGKLYIERILNIDGCVKPYVLSYWYGKNNLVDYKFEVNPRNIFVVTNTTRENLLEWTDNKNIVEVERIEDLKISSSCNFYLVKKDFGNCREILSRYNNRIYAKLKYYKRVFYARFDNKADLFLWVCNDGQVEVATDIWSHISVGWSEQDFVDKVVRERKDAVYFTGEPGWGKSQLLISLGRKIRKGVVIYITMSAFLDKIRKMIGNGDFTTTHVKNVLRQVLLCEKDCEKYILNRLLEQRVKRVELMLDGLDEVPSKNKDLAVKAIKLIQNELAGIRLWITSREKFPNDLYCNRFKYITCQISQFGMYDQIAFFRTFWYEKHIFNGNKEDIDDLAFKFVDSLQAEVKDKLKTCISMSPLHCRLLAELYKDNLNEMSMSIIKGQMFNLSLSPTLIYEALIEKKILVYIREKEKIFGDANSLVVKEAREQFLKKHVLLALTLFIPEELYTNMIDEIEDLQESGLEKLGIWQVSENSEEASFVHRTYAEYLVARFIFRVFKSGKVYICDGVKAYHELIVYVIAIAIQGDDDLLRFPVICMFLNEMLKMSDVEFEKIILEWEKKYGKHQPNFEANLNISNYLGILFRLGYFNIAKLILNIWVNDDNDMLNSKILEIAIRNRLPLNAFISLCEMFGYEQMGMNIENCNHFEVFGLALRLGSFEISSYLIEKWFPPKAWQLIPKIRKGGGGIMHIILEYNSQCFNDLDRESENDKVKLMKLIWEMDASVIEIKDKKGQTPLMTISLVDFSGYCFWLKDFMIKELGAYDNGKVNTLDINTRRNIFSTFYYFVESLFLYCKILWERFRR